LLVLTDRSFSWLLAIRPWFTCNSESSVREAFVSSWMRFWPFSTAAVNSWSRASSSAVMRSTWLRVCLIFRMSSSTPCSLTSTWIC